MVQLAQRGVSLHCCSGLNKGFICPNSHLVKYLNKTSATQRWLQYYLYADLDSCVHCVPCSAQFVSLGWKTEVKGVQLFLMVNVCVCIQEGCLDVGSMSKTPPNRRGITFEVGAQLEARDSLKNWWVMASLIPLSSILLFSSLTLSPKFPFPSLLFWACRTVTVML